MTATDTAAPNNEIGLLVNASRTSPPLRDAVAAVESYVAALVARVETLEAAHADATKMLTPLWFKDAHRDAYRLARVAWLDTYGGETEKAIAAAELKDTSDVARALQWSKDGTTLEPYTMDDARAALSAGGTTPPPQIGGIPITIDETVPPGVVRVTRDGETVVELELGGAVAPQVEADHDA